MLRKRQLPNLECFTAIISRGFSGRRSEAEAKLPAGSISHYGFDMNQQQETIDWGLLSLACFWKRTVCFNESACCGHRFLHTCPDRFRGPAAEEAAGAPISGSPRLRLCPIFSQFRRWKSAGTRLRQLSLESDASALVRPRSADFLVDPEPHPRRQASIELFRVGGVFGTPQA